MRHSAKNLFYYLLILHFFISSCSITKYMAEDEQLYVGSEIILQSEFKITDRSKLQSELNRVIRPRENEKLAGLKIGAWARARKNADKTNFLINWLDKKYGEEIVTQKQLDANRNVNILLNRLENNGFFGASIRVEELKTSSDTKIAYRYYINLPSPYTLVDYTYRTSNFPEIDQQIEILTKDSESLIQLGERFSFDALRKERERIAESLKNNGYYNFRADLLLFQADTIVREEFRGVKLRLRIKPDAVAESMIPYKVNDVVVYPNYSLGSNTDMTEKDSVELDGVYYVQKPEFFKPSKMHNYLMMRPNSFYNQGNERITSNRLAGLNTYRYVNIRYEEIEELKTDSLAYLNSFLYLSPLNKMNVSAEIQTLSKSNNFLGPALILNYRNRNLMKGGELLSLRAKFGYERQLAGREFTNLSSYELGLKAELAIPRLISPIHLGQRYKYGVPRTKIGLSYDFLDRVQLFRLNSFLATFGYEWNINRKITHQFNPISVNFINLGRTSAEFDEILEANPFLQLSFQQQFIAGMTYSFQYSQLADEDKRSKFFFMANVDLAGNAVGLIQELAGIPTEDKTLFGQNYAQFVKLDFDFRHYYQLSDNSKLVSRLYAGYGLPYGNSEALPYVKQFFSGGPNSIRAFRIRSLGPGAYATETFGAANFFDQAGDVKLEANVEYRFPLVSYLKGAVFADAGNIWLQNDNPALGGGALSANFVNEIALGVGYGFRLDIEFFVIRLDIASPLRKPVVGENRFEWQSEFSPLSRSWRQNNIIWNFGIGYPF